MLYTHSLWSAKGKQVLCFGITTTSPLESTNRWRLRGQLAPTHLIACASAGSLPALNLSKRLPLYLYRWDS